MRLHVHRAIFGVHQEGCHAVLAASLDNRDVLAEVRLHSDMPTHHQSGIMWEPFERGYIIRDWYALCRTFPDPEASRGGMVTTFAVLVRLDEIAEINDFGALIAQLPTARSDKWPCEPTDMEISGHGGSVIEVPGFAKLVRELIARPDVNRPVAWIGQAGSASVIAALWNAFWPTMRRRFQFDLLFAPMDLDRLGLTVAVVPEAVAARWPQGPRASANDPPPANPTVAECAMLGLPEGEPVRVLLRELNADPTDLRALKTAALCVEYRVKLPQLSFQELHAFAGLLADLAPRPEQGRTIKAAMLKKLTSVSGEMTAANILALRNFPVSSMMGGDVAVADLATRWLRLHLPKPANASATATVLLQALKKEAYCAAWNEGVLNEAAIVLENPPAGMADVLWNWWIRDWQLGVFSASHLPTTGVVEQALVTACPDPLACSIAKPLRAMAAARGWGVLHAAVCGMTMAPADTFSAQLKFPKADAVLPGLEFLAQRFPSRATLAAALATADSRLVSLAGARCVREPVMLATLDFTQPVARDVLSASLLADPRAWSRLANRRSILHAILDEVMDGKNVGTGLLDHLSSTPEADLADYPRRERIWAHLPVPAAQGFLDATAAGWIAGFRADPSAKSLPERPLAAVIFRAPQCARLLAIEQPADLAAALHAFEHFSQLNEAALQDWIDRLTRTFSVGELTAIEARRLGRLIVTRKWSVAARSLGDALSRRRDFAPALRECLSMFGLFDRLTLRLRLPGKADLDREEFWEALETALSEIYPKGPMEDGLWSRAGGDESTLDLDGNGRKQWRAALGVLKRGGGGKHFTTRKLLARACSDFPRNSQLPTLQEFARELDV